MHVCHKGEGRGCRGKAQLCTYEEAKVITKYKARLRSHRKKRTGIVVDDKPKRYRGLEYTQDLLYVLYNNGVVGPSQDMSQQKDKG